MDTLLLLFYFQFSGIVISFLLTYADQIAQKKYLSITTRKLIFANRTNSTWMIQYLQDHPKKIFKRYFPEMYNIAIAIRRYKKLNSLKGKGFYNEKEYERKLEEILPLVEITSDLKLISKKIILQ